MKKAPMMPKAPKAKPATAAPAPKAGGGKKVVKRVGY
jgi:hypothetical protein